MHARVGRLRLPPACGSRRGLVTISHPRKIPVPLQFASRLDNVETSAIRELFKLLGKPGIISFAGGFRDGAVSGVEGVKEASQKTVAEEPGGALQYGTTEGYEPLRTQLAAFMRGKG